MQKMQTMICMYKVQHSVYQHLQIQCRSSQLPKWVKINFSAEVNCSKHIYIYIFNFLEYFTEQECNIPHNFYKST